MTSITGLTKETSKLKAAIATETNERKAETGQLREQIERMEKRFDNFKPPGLGAADDDTTRERQVIVSGFKESDEQSIVRTLQKMLEMKEITQKIAAMFTFMDPSKVGVIEFETVAAKRGFFKKMGQTKVVLDADTTLFLNNNETWENRVIIKTLGHIKYQMTGQMSIAHTEIYIDRKKQVVKYKGKTKAWVNKDGVFEYDADMNNIKSKVEEIMATWMEKRTREGK